MKDTTGHSVTQEFSINAKLRIFSDTWLEDLSVEDRCDCGPQVAPPPLELVFLLDGSDSFNIEVALKKFKRFKTDFVNFRRKASMEKSLPKHRLNTLPPGLQTF